MPRSWWIPKSDRLLLAVVSLIFWYGALTKALFEGSYGASVYAFYGLGLLYLICSIANVRGALQRECEGAVPEQVKSEFGQMRLLSQLLLVLVGNLVLNVIVLDIYLMRGTPFTLFDLISFMLALAIVAVPFIRFGLASLYKNPIVRGWVAIACKTLPQLILVVLFIVDHGKIHGFSVIAMLGIISLSLLRFIPTVRAYWHDPQSKNLRGLMIGETGNTVSALLLLGVWTVCMILWG